MEILLPPKQPPKQVLREIARTYPQAWQIIKACRAGKGKGLPDWPDWCYVPIAAGFTVVGNQIKDTLNDAYFNRLTPAVIVAAATWRISQGIYRFDPDLYKALIQQPLDGNLPCDLLKRLPEWCIYIETIPDLDAVQSGQRYILGFWAHLEYDPYQKREELRFVFFVNNGLLLPIPVHLGNWTLKEGIQRVIDEAKEMARQHGIPISPSLDNIADLTPFVQLVLYLCADNTDIPIRPQHPKTRVRLSGQVDVVKEPRIWTVGERVGAAIRKYQETQTHRKDFAETQRMRKAHASPRGHIRRAHWHSFWTGPRNGERKLILHWLPPIPVNMDPTTGEGPVVIHKVYRPKKKEG